MSKSYKHLCETCKNKEVCTASGELERRKALLDRAKAGHSKIVVVHSHKDADYTFDAVLTTIVVECQMYEEDRGGKWK